MTEPLLPSRGQRSTQCALQTGTGDDRQECSLRGSFGRALLEEEVAQQSQRWKSHFWALCVTPPSCVREDSVEGEETERKAGDRFHRALGA